MLKSIAKRAISAAVRKAVNSTLPIREFGDVKALEMIPSRVAEFATARGWNETQRHDLLFEVGQALLPGFSMNDVGRYFLDDTEFRSYFARFVGRRGNWKNYERRWLVGQMLRLVEGVSGDLAECGVFEGAAAYQLCRFAEAAGRRVHLFDSFEGISDPGNNDGTHWNRGDLSASEQMVRRNLAEFDCFDTFKGWIPERFGEAAAAYCFVHIDVDLEGPTRDSLRCFYPKVQSRGIILLDDHGYNTCPGARKATLEYMADKPEPVIDLPTGQGLIMKN
jgi:O-methyltransferase